MWSAFSMTIASWDKSTPRSGSGRQARAHRPWRLVATYPAAPGQTRVAVPRLGSQGAPPCGRARRRPPTTTSKERRCRSRPATPWWSGPAPTAWSRPTRSPTPGGTSCWSRRRTRSGVRCAAPRAWRPASSPTCSAPSTRSPPPARSSATCTWSSTAWSGGTPPTWWPTRSPTAGAGCCAAPPPTPRRASTSTTPATVTPGCGWWPAGTASATRCSTPSSRRSPRCGRACACCAARAWPARSTSPASGCRRCAGSAARSSAARRPGSC